MRKSLAICAIATVSLFVTGCCPFCGGSSDGDGTCDPCCEVDCGACSVSP